MFALYVYARNAAEQSLAYLEHRACHSGGVLLASCCIGGIGIVGFVARTANKESPGGILPTLLADQQPLSFEHETSFRSNFDENVAAADIKFNGRLVEINLVRGRVSREPDGDGYFVASDIAAPWHGSPGLICHLNQSSVKKAATARGPLQAFKIRGVCRGRVDDRTAYKGYCVILDECEVLAVLEWINDKTAPKGGTWREIAP